MEELPLIGIHNVIAMNFDSETDCVFRLDIDKDRIMKQCLSDGSLPETLAMSQLSSVEGMAFDHISKILYFVDVTRKSIELVKVDSQKGGHMRKTIIRGEKIKPRELQNTSLCLDQTNLNLIVVDISCSPYCNIHLI